MGYEQVLFVIGIDPARDAMVKSAMAFGRNRYVRNPDLVDAPHIHASPYTSFVQFAMHALAGMLVARPAYPQSIRHALAQCLDMYWPLVAQIKAKSALPQREFAEAFNRDWWESQPALSLKTVPCDTALDPRPASEFWHALPSILCLSEVHTPSPLESLLRKAHPGKINLRQFVGKALKVRDIVERRRTCEDDEQGGEVVIKHGIQIMRYLIQWCCVSHVGGYAHCNTIVTNWSVREINSTVWNSINSMTEDQIVAETDAMLRNPIVLTFVLTEFMESVLRSMPAVYDWLCSICRWREYGERMIEYIDAYRSFLPLPHPPDASTFANMTESEAAYFRDMENAFGVPDEVPEEVTGEPYMQKDLNLFVVETGARDRTQQPKPIRRGVITPPKPTVIDRSNPLGARAAETMTKKTCYTAMHRYLKHVFTIGSTSRIPRCMWEFLWDTAPLDPFIVKQASSGRGQDAAAAAASAAPLGPSSLNAILSCSIKDVLFAPTRSERKGQPQPSYLRPAGSRVSLEEVRTVTKHILDHRWVLACIGPSAEMNDVTATRFIAPHLHADYFCVARTMALVMLFYECNHEAVARMMMLVMLFYQRFKCGKPTLTRVFELLRTRFPYEHAIVYGMLSGWREWSYVHHVQLSAEGYETQLRRIGELTRVKRMKEGAVPECIDWLLFCPNCDRVYTLVTKFCSPGKFPFRYQATDIAGFHKLRIDTRTGELYCNRKNDKHAEVCNRTKLIRYHMAGKMVFLNGKPHVQCFQPFCINKIERSPYDVFNEFGCACPPCSFSARVGVEQAIEEKKKAAEKEAKVKRRADEAEAHQTAIRVKEEADAKLPGALSAAQLEEANAIASLPRHLITNRKYVSAHSASSTDTPSSNSLKALAELNRVKAATRKLVK